MRSWLIVRVCLEVLIWEVMKLEWSVVIGEEREESWKDRKISKFKKNKSQGNYDDDRDDYVLGWGMNGERRDLTKTYEYIFKATDFWSYIVFIVMDHEFIIVFAGRLSQSRECMHLVLQYKKIVSFVHTNEQNYYRCIVFVNNLIVSFFI